MPIETGSCNTGIARAVGPIDPREIRATAAKAAATQTAKTDASKGIARSVGPLRSGEALDVGAPPVDVERVAQIRRAVETGRYPLMPAHVADAMIAAGMLLKTTQ